MQSVTVTIGRNVPARHADAARRDGYSLINENDVAILNAGAWHDFTDLIVDALKNFESQVNGIDDTWTEIHNGVGEWEGVLEESRKVTIFFEASPLQLLPEHIANLKQELLSIRTGYYQDALAIAIAESELI